MKRYRAFASLLAAAIVLVSWGASGAAADTFTETTHWRDVPFAIPDSDCSGDPVALSGFSSGVQHLTLLESGGLHVTFTEEVSFTAVRGTETFTGRWTAWGGLNLNNQNAASTFTLTATGSSDAGTKLLFHVTAHFSASATGVVREFDKLVCVD